MSCASISHDDASQVCNKIDEIRILPFKWENVDDEAYNQIIAEGYPVVPCLIDRISDTTTMPDPRQGPPYEGVTVGDVAFFVFLDISKQDLKSFLPKAVEDQFETQGVYAYFKFVEDPDNRKLLQENVREWMNDKEK
jgi:hypothetical protein